MIEECGSCAGKEGGLFHSISSHNVITAAQRKRSPAGM